MYLQHSDRNSSRTRKHGMNETPVPVVVVDPTTRFTSQYSLAVKYYLHRNFNKSFKLVHPLIEELRRDPQTVDAALVAKIAKIYLSLVSLMLNEVINLKLLKLSIPRHSLNFPDYIGGNENPHFATALLEDFNNGGLFRLVHELHLAGNDEIVLQCFVTEAANNLKPDSLQKQVESYLSQRGLFPGPLTDAAFGEEDSSGRISTLRKIEQFYLSQCILKNQGIEKARNAIERLFVIDDEAVHRWIDWIQACDANMRGAEEEADENDEDEDDEEAFYEESSFDDDSDDQGYASDLTAVTTNTATSKTTVATTAPQNSNRHLASRNVSGQSVPTTADFPADSRPEATSHNTSKSKRKAKQKGRGKSKSKSRSRSGKTDDSSLIAITNNYMSRQLASFKDLVAYHFGKYPVAVKLVAFVIFVVLLLCKNYGSLQNFQLRKKLVAFYSKLLQTAQLAFKVTFL